MSQHQSHQHRPPTPPAQVFHPTTPKPPVHVLPQPIPEPWGIQLELLSQLIQAVSGVSASIDKLILQNTKLQNIMALDATKLGQLLTLVQQLLNTLPNDAATIATLQQQIADMTANDAALDALAPQLDPLIAGVTAATPGTAAPPTVQPI